MSKKGFYIKSIIATGEGLIPSKVEFRDGCNLLFGPSETGKSSVFSIIDYMLGASSEPNEVKESRGYTDYYMEFVTYEDDAVHTAHRRLKENSVVIEDCSFDAFGTGTAKPFSYVAKGSSNKSYSNYLMVLNGFADNLQLKKSMTSKVKMTFTRARHLFLVGEDRVVSKHPIFIPINDTSSVTQEKSFLYYLTTGQDDSSFKETEDAKIRRSRIGGMITLTQENLDSVNAKILELGDVSFADFKGDEFFNAHKEQIAKEEKTLSEYYKQRNHIDESLRKLKSTLLFTREFLKRMTLLKEHYLLDLQRYEHLFEGLSLMIPLTEDHLCPVCHSHIVNSDVVNDDYKDALKSEYDKTKTKLTDIEKVLAAKSFEIKQVEREIAEKQQMSDSVQNQIKNFEPHLNDLKETLLKYQENIEKKAYSTFLQEEAQRLNKKINELQKQQKEKPENTNYIRQASIDLDFCNSIKIKLKDWNVIGDVPVVYEDSEFDFSIGGQKRVMCGKGSRGVTCTAILMTLIEYCQEKGIPFSKMLVVDSPLTAHFDDERVDADETTQAKFFKYCNDTEFNYQLILIDNKAPTQTERENMNGIHFIEFSESGRNGFYMGKKDE